MTITGKAKLAGIIGWPVEHSRSPQLHNFWLAEYRIDGAYLPLRVAVEDFPVLIAALPRLGFRGANLTLPHKERVIPFIDTLDPLARRIGAVNTIAWRDDGSLFGTNSDGFGFFENLKERYPAFDPASGRCIILGAGGSARAVAAVLQDKGARDLIIVNRTMARAEALCRDLGGTIDLQDFASLPRLLATAQLVINTTSLGMSGQPPLDCPLGGLPKGAIVADLVYAPLETEFLRQAAARGLDTLDGLGMLLHQARVGFELWFGQSPLVTPALRAQILAAP